MTAFVNLCTNVTVFNILPVLTTTRVLVKVLGRVVE